MKSSYNMKSLARRILLIIATLSIIIVPLRLFDFNTISEDSWSILLFFIYALSLPFLFRALFVFCGLITIESPKRVGLTEDERELASTVKGFSVMSAENKIVITGIPEDIQVEKPVIDIEERERRIKEREKYLEDYNKRLKARSLAINVARKQFEAERSRIKSQQRK